ncbi:MAG: PDZ domain-containing protein, partial [Aliifodinibius sp.]|nr:PDZ domain-containing protein [Fodinibius sp.]NIY24849.1 PDZ domain-containing protein [Fodinibius sp.]
VIRGWLGIYIQDINENLAKAMDLPGTEGALVADVVEDSPAEEAGLQEEDVILELNGKKIPNTADLRNNIASTPPGTEVTLTIF